jgi:SAM dependent carboxyl methyltransferase
MSMDAVPTQTSMEGAGFYNRHSAAQAAGIDQMLVLLEQAAGEVAIGEEVLVLADYGSSQGRNSMAPVRVAIEAVRSRCGLDKPVLVFHTDLPSNDFTSLFHALDEDPNSYLSGSGAVYPAAVGRSFFGAILPPGSVHLGWNSWAVHWLSQKTVDAPDHVSPTLSAVPEVRAAACDQSARDWSLFLQSRSAELRGGGKMLCLVIIGTGQPVNSDQLWNHLWDSIVELGTEGKLTESEQLRMTLPIWYRSMSELRAPFASGDEFAGLRLRHLEATSAPDPFWDSFQKSGDSQAFGVSWANTMRAIAAPTVVDALDTGRDQLVDELFQRVAERITAAPMKYDWDLAAVVMSKAP